MSEQSILTKLIEAMDDFTQLEQEYRENAANAFDTDDYETFQAMQANTFRRVKNIKMWREQLHTLVQSVQDTIVPEIEEVEKIDEEPDFPSPETILENSEESSLSDTEEENSQNGIEKEADMPLVNITLFNRTSPCTQWGDALVKVCETMIVRNAYKAANFDKEESLNSGKKINFSRNKHEILFNAKKLSNGIWVETNRNSNQIADTCYKILALCGYGEKDLLFQYQ